MWKYVWFHLCRRVEELEAIWSNHDGVIVGSHDVVIVSSSRRKEEMTKKSGWDIFSLDEFIVRDIFFFKEIISIPCITIAISIMDYL